MISKEVTNSLKEYNITAEQYYILSLLKSNETDAITYLQKHLKERNILIRNLYRRGFISIEDPDIENIGFSNKITLTELGEEVLSESKSISWFDEWYSLWPEGVKSGDYYVRSGRADCEKKMLKFLKEQTYNEEQILAATKNYINRLASKGYAYMQLASNFIYKDSKSTLAAECEALSSNIEPQSFIKDV